MTFRGIVKNGVVVVEDATGLREGDVVEVARVRRVKPARARSKPGTAPKERAGRVADPLPGFGMWKDRPEWKGMTGAEVAAELRRGAFRRKARS